MEIKKDTANTKTLDLLCINAIRTLSMDAVQVGTEMLFLELYHLNKTTFSLKLRFELNHNNPFPFHCLSLIICQFTYLTTMFYSFWNEIFNGSFNDTFLTVDLFFFCRLRTLDILVQMQSFLSFKMNISC
jgi:hypothetical protein